MTHETTLEKREAKEAAKAERTWSGRYYTPHVDILEDEGELTVLADMPGVSTGDVDIRFENGELSIHGKVKPRHADVTHFLLHEYGFGDFYRTFQISEAIDRSGSRRSGGRRPRPPSRRSRRPSRARSPSKVNCNADQERRVRSRGSAAEHPRWSASVGPVTTGRFSTETPR